MEEVLEYLDIHLNIPISGIVYGNLADREACTEVYRLSQGLACWGVWGLEEEGVIRMYLLLLCHSCRVVTLSHDDVI